MRTIKMTAVSLVVAILLIATNRSSLAQTASPLSSAPAATPTAPLLPDPVAEALRGGPESWTSPQRLSSTLQVMLLLTVLSLAPAMLMMTTSFVRIVVVLGLLRQAIGTQQLPPSQVITTLALFMTLLVMGPTWTEVYNTSIRPYSRGEISDPEVAWNKGVVPLKHFMSRQIDLASNSDDVWLFYEYLPANQRSTKPPETYEDIPLVVMLPAFMLSELKVAFLIGFQIYLPFLILDLVVSSVTISMGMMMLPPVMISLPLKLLLFVLVDGWTLIIGMLLESFGGS
jgi:flagellar biosynthetic protein FliP